MFFNDFEKIITLLHIFRFQVLETTIFELFSKLSVTLQFSTKKAMTSPALSI